MWKNYLKSAVRFIICLPLIILDVVGYIIALLWMGFRILMMGFMKWLAKKIPLSEDCPYAVTVESWIRQAKEAHQTLFVDFFDVLL